MGFQQGQQVASQLHVYLAGDSVHSREDVALALRPAGEETDFEAARPLCHRKPHGFAKNLFATVSTVLSCGGEFLRCFIEHLLVVWRTEIIRLSLVNGFQGRIGIHLTYGADGVLVG
jgi:hypothetical protein